MLKNLWIPMSRVVFVIRYIPKFLKIGENVGIRTKLKKKFSASTLETQYLEGFIQNVMEEYDFMIDFLIFLVRQLIRES